MTPPERVRVVVDTNVLISRLLAPESPPAAVMAHLKTHGTLLFSDATLAELQETLLRPKFARYIDQEDIRPFLMSLHRISTHIPILHRIQACRDTKDDKFLEVAVGGAAHYLITGDKDLLALHPFRSLPILSPSDFLKQAGNS